ncbi:MAG: D-glycero-beta-D-manno-heptose 1,7-bisphosphate 7-phosphatase [Planctomycetes bacterium]|nr:D-glycero-beta-D-manno-heptose 1,7-bisphosphate 7-phosphatase [Planctomycetota bacterium]
MRRAVFLDRDGTLVDELGFLRDPADLRLLPGAAEGLRLFNRAGWLAIVVTNQSGIARGLFDERQLAEVHARLEAELARRDARLDAILYCPHHPDHGRAPLRMTCTCRKPAAGMLLAAAERFALELGACWTVGDSLRDLEAGRRAGLAGGILVLTGKGRDELARASAGASVLTAADLPTAARAILASTPEAAPDQGR